jgi:hypothetical protein
LDDDIRRPDVQQAHPREAKALESGFEFRFELSNGKRIETEKVTVPNPRAFRSSATGMLEP